MSRGEHAAARVTQGSPPRSHAPRSIALRLSGGDAACDECEVADTFLRRLRGLLGRAELARGHGMLFPSTGSVHTCFMRFPIDVVFLDADGRVLRVVEGMRPWRMALARRARSVLEIAPGEAARRGISPGESLTEGHVRRGG